MQKLSDKIVLITGANGQLGQGLSKALLAEGAFVYITDVHEEININFKAVLSDSKLDNYKYIKMDVTSENSIIQAHQLMDKDVNILINNAGIAVFTPFEQRTEEELDNVYKVNIRGLIMCSKIFSKKMQETKRGKIINIASMYGVVPPDKRIYGDSGRNSSEIYGGTKAAVIQITRYLAAYLGEYNIQVNAISPGGIFNNQKQFFLDNYIDKVPLKRMATVEDFNGLICFLSSDDSSYVTGQNISADGGFSLNQ
jgi:3-oxoacyl-[acyl-carrier protein] reductase